MAIGLDPARGALATAEGVEIVVRNAGHVAALGEAGLLEIEGLGGRIALTLIERRGRVQHPRRQEPVHLPVPVGHGEIGVAGHLGDDPLHVGDLQPVPGQEAPVAVLGALGVEAVLGLP